MPKLTEKKWLSIAARSFTANGTSEGVVTLASTLDFRVKQKIIIKASTLPPLNLEVKRVLSASQLVVGPSGPITQTSSLTAYTTALSASIEAQEQPRSNIEQKEYVRSVYAEEPIVAIRTIPVDELGDYYNSDNPLPVRMDGKITIENLNVQLTASDNDPNPGDVHDSVRIGDGVYELKINADGSITVQQGSANAPAIENLTMPVAGTEYSYALPASTKQFTIKDRSGDAKTRIAFTLGDTSTNFITLDMGCTYVAKNLLTLAGFTLYLQSNKANRIIEILSWS